MSLLPSTEPPPFDPQQKEVLRRARFFAGAAIGLCVLAPVGTILAVGGESLRHIPSDTQVSANRAGIALFIACSVVGIGLRMQTYKANWQGDLVTPAGYAKAMRRYACAVVAGLLAACAIGLKVGHASAAIDLPIFAIGLLVFGFPNGKPMLPQPPDLGSRK